MSVNSANRPPSLPDAGQLRPAAGPPLELRFAFDGPLGDVLRAGVIEDSSHWQLSWKFRCYYLVRAWIPTALRQVLQRTRNGQLPVGDEWYCPQAFWARLMQAAAEQRSQLVLHPWPDGYQHAAVLTHDIESADGLPRVDKLAQLEEQFGLRSAWYFVPSKYRIDRGMLADLRERGHEVAVHGYNHDGRLFTSARLFAQRAAYINQAAQRWQAAGFRSPMMHRQLNWMQALEVDYDASCFDVDPYQAMPGGVGGAWPFIAGRLVELPCTLPQDHTLFVTLKQSGTDIWRRKYAWLKRLRGMAMCLVHPDYLDSPKHWDWYRELLEMYVAAEDGWKCLPQDISHWWLQRDASSVVGQSISGPAAQRGRIVSIEALFAQMS